MLNRIMFENLGRAEYDKIAFRNPRRGEYYLSGAVVQAYIAPNDLSSPYQVVKPRMKTLVKYNSNGE